MPLSMKEGLGPDHIVSDENPGPPQKGAQPPIFGPCLLWPGLIPTSVPSGNLIHPAVFNDHRVCGRQTAG